MSVMTPPVRPAPATGADPAADRLADDLVQPGHRLFGTVWINPDRVGGAPCFYGTRVPVQHLFDYLEGGDRLAGFPDGFPRRDARSGRRRAGVGPPRTAGRVAAAMRVLPDHAAGGVI